MKLINFSYFVFFVFYSMTSFADKSFFTNISNLLPDQKPRLSYGVAVTDFDNDGLEDRFNRSPSLKMSIISFGIVGFLFGLLTILIYSILSQKTLRRKLSSLLSLK